MKNNPITQKIHTFFSQHREQTFSTKHVIVPAFSTPVGIYYVKSGLVKQYVLTPQGQELVVNVYKPGSFFPMMWAVAEIPNNYFFETIEPVTVYRAPVEDTLQFLQKNPDVMFDLLRRLYIGIDGLVQQMTSNALGDTRHKVMTSLYILAKRFGDVSGKRVQINRHITHKELGVLSGISRESVTRTLTQLQKEGVIELKDRHMILNNFGEFERELS